MVLALAAYLLTRSGTAYYAATAWGCGPHNNLTFAVDGVEYHPPFPSYKNNSCGSLWHHVFTLGFVYRSKWRDIT